MRAVDRGFVGVNTRLDPGQLPDGYVAYAINRRFDRGTVRNRWGIVRPQWGGVSGAQQGRADLVAGDTDATLYLARPPMDLASIAGPGIPPGTLVVTYVASPVQPLTIDRTDITIDRTDITIDQDMA